LSYHTLNLGILAHVDAGKTTLTERLLHLAGVIDEVGSVDEGTTQTDTLPLERQRGITIKSAVASFEVGDLAVNVVDTPGHPDFIAEVERALTVLDGAVLVVSAVEGVQSQTRVLMRALRRLGIPTLIFVNKIDRVGAQASATLMAISERLSVPAVAMGAVRNLGEHTAEFADYDTDSDEFLAHLVDQLSALDDRLLAEYLAHEATVTPELLLRTLAEQTAAGHACPVYFGSAITGAGVDSLRSAIPRLLPRSSGDPDGPLSGTVFKIERGPGNQKVAYLRVRAGTVRTREHVYYGDGQEGVVTSLAVFGRGAATRQSMAGAGDVAKVGGLHAVQVGDHVSGDGAQRTPTPQFPPPTLEAVVVPEVAGERSRLWIALTQLQEQDPLIGVRRGDVGREISVSLYGEVQREVIAAMLQSDFDLRVTFHETTPICIERPRGVGEAAEYLNAPTNPFAATLRLRVAPGAIDSGVELSLQVQHEGIPLHLFKGMEGFRSAMRQYAGEALREGLFGWRVTDCEVTVLECGYGGSDGPPSKRGPAPTFRDFQHLTAVVLFQALAAASTVVCQPMVRATLEIPSDRATTLTAMLARLGAAVRSSMTMGSYTTIETVVPLAHATAIQRQLPRLTSGEGSLESTVVGYEPVLGRPPTRSRTAPSPLNLKEYLRAL
jgi:ribosomal protection tetracycline resistance protein